jgi:hypothetical protein
MMSTRPTLIEVSESGNEPNRALLDFSERIRQGEARLSKRAIKPVHK